MPKQVTMFETDGGELFETPEEAEEAEAKEELQKFCAHEDFTIDNVVAVVELLHQDHKFGQAIKRYSDAHKAAEIIWTKRNDEKIAEHKKKEAERNKQLDAMEAEYRKNGASNLS